ncbi:hypothetical protein [Streptomyces sp. 900105755]
MRTRRLVRDFERRTNSGETMAYWSMILLMTRRLARPHIAGEGEPDRHEFGRPAAHDEGKRARGFADLIRAPQLSALLAELF